MKKKIVIILAVLVCFVIIKYAPNFSEKDAELECVKVERVIDGDTVDVINNQGELVRIRMIGVNTPESVSPDTEANSTEGEEASAFTKKYLQEGMQIFLEYDIETRDIYDRTLAYIWLDRDCNRDNFEDFRKYNYGAILLENTYCEAVHYPPNEKYRSWYERIEADSAFDQ